MASLIGFAIWSIVVHLIAIGLCVQEKKDGYGWTATMMFIFAMWGIVSLIWVFSNGN
jgi:hypothetical protein